MKCFGMNLSLIGSLEGLLGEVQANAHVGVLSVTHPRGPYILGPLYTVLSSPDLSLPVQGHNQTVTPDCIFFPRSPTRDRHRPSIAFHYLVFLTDIYCLGPPYV